jgi:hypothetical protein
MRVLVTGMIAGMDDHEYIDKAIALAAADGLTVDSYNLIDALESTGGKKLDMLLGTTDYLFEVLREREYRKIGFELEKNDSQHAVIRVPATIEWNRINVKLKDHKEIAEFIKPDVIVTLIDAEWLIRERFDNPDDSNDFLSRIKNQNHTIQEILSWMNEEVSLSEDWAEHMGIRHYVIPTGQDPASLYKLIKHAEVPSFYVSYSMTHCDQVAREEINAVIDGLQDYC